MYTFSSPGRSVQLIITYEPPVRRMLRTFGALHVMNFVTWDRAYSIFPHLSLDATTMCFVAATKPGDLRMFDKYFHRGFSCIALDVAKSYSEVREDRCVGDRYCREVALSDINLGQVQPKVVMLPQFKVLKSSIRVFSASRVPQRVTRGNGDNDDNDSDQVTDSIITSTVVSDLSSQVDSDSVDSDSFIESS